MACLATDLSDSGQTVVAGFSTHPHWDHLLWHARLGPAPRYGTARCAATVRARLSDAGAKARVAELIPPDIVEQVPLDLLGLITGLPAETTQIPWDGPQVRIIEHLAHAPVHAALLIEERGVLVAGDMSVIVMRCAACRWNDHDGMSARTEPKYTVILLERLWRKSGERLSARCRGLA